MDPEKHYPFSVTNRNSEYSQINVVLDEIFRRFVNQLPIISVREIW